MKQESKARDPQVDFSCVYRDILILGVGAMKLLWGRELNSGGQEYLWKILQPANQLMCLLNVGGNKGK